MTIPIEPGPFQFLAEAGQALGNYAQTKEERTRHGEEIAHRAMQDIILDIKEGRRPASILAEPEIQELSKKAWGIKIPAKILPQPRETVAAIQQKTLEGGGAAARSLAGVQSEPVAAGAEAEAEVKGRKAKAQLAAGTPEQEVDVETLENEAKAKGLKFNRNVYDAAITMFGTDKKFKQLAVEAATGVLDGRLRALYLQRESYVLERQRMIERANLFRDMQREYETAYEKAVQQWSNDATVSGDPESYKKNNPKPDPEEFLTEFLKPRGYTPDQFRKRYQQALEGATSETGKPDTETKAETSGPASAAAPQNKVQTAVSNALKADPAAVGDWLGVHEISGDEDPDHFDEDEVKAILFGLKSKMTAAKYRKMLAAYTDRKRHGPEVEGEQKP